jgi:hypothetical protein
MTSTLSSFDTLLHMQSPFRSPDITEDELRLIESYLQPMTPDLLSLPDVEDNDVVIIGSMSES